MFPLVGPSLNLTTCLVCFQFHFSSDQCHLSFFLKLKTHICLKEVQVSFETSFYSYFMRMLNNQQWKTKKPPFISFNLFGSISITNTFFSVLLFLLVVFLFFWGGGRGCGTFSLIIKIIKMHTAICTSLCFDS